MMCRNDSQKQVVDFEEGEGVTSRFKSYLHEKSGSAMYVCIKHNTRCFENTLHCILRKQESNLTWQKIQLEYCFRFDLNRMVTDGFDDERENVDELWGSTSLFNIIHCIISNRPIARSITTHYLFQSCQTFYGVLLMILICMFVYISYCGGPSNVEIKLGS